MAENKITWSATSIRQFTAAIDYIAIDSEQNAQNVKDKILDKLDQIAQSPNICPPDKYKLNNDGNYRSLLIFNYQISYLIKADVIVILRVRHTSMKPKTH